MHSMNKPLRTVAISCLVVAAVCLELFYFRFHTYFQRTEIQETLLPAPSGQEAMSRTVATGTFVRVDALHGGSGTARIVDRNGERYLLLENFEVTNGPDLYVYLTESKSPGKTLESLSKYISLGRLKGNAGNQIYEIPGTFRGYDTAVIWCQQFGVLFSYAVMM